MPSDAVIGGALAARILNISRSSKRAIALVIDAAQCVTATYVAFYLRLGEWVYPQDEQWLAYLLAIIFALPVFIVFGLYRAIFRYAGSAAFVAIGRACIAYGLAYAMVFTFVGVTGVPRTIGLIQPVLLILSVTASRALARWWLGGMYRQLFRRRGERPCALIYGAGSAGRQLAATIAHSDEMDLLGFVDDDSSLWGSTLHGKRIFPPSAIEPLVTERGVSDVLLAIPSATRRQRNDILELLRAINVSVRTLPGMIDIARGRVTVSDLRPLEIEDLLGRDAVKPDPVLLARTTTGRTVLVSGAGGSIGSELCRQILSLNPAVLLLIEQSEFALYQIHHEMLERMAAVESAHIEVVPLLGSVTDPARMAQVMASWRPETVFHAAAYKHVPLVEHNPIEGIRNNVIGTRVMVEAARQHEVQDFILISTDKAVRPTNVMGASKRLAEMILQSIAANDPGRTRFSMVRFGNVLGSSGSVVPLFRRQIVAGGPVTITHEDVTRYFMTIPEAAQLVIQASALAKGGDVFLLDMGPPVRIRDLAETMIRMSGLTVQRPDGTGDIEIRVVGLRPGEKLHEELLLGNSPAPTDHPQITTASETFDPWNVLEPQLDALQAAIDAGAVEEVISLLRRAVPDFAYMGKIVDWTFHRTARAHGADMLGIARAS